MTNPINILFYPGGGLGDTVVSMPVLMATHEYFPDAEIDIITGQNIEALGEIYHGIAFIKQIFPNPPGTEFVLGEAYDLLIVANEQVVLNAKEKAQAASPEFIELVQAGFKKRDAFGLANHVGNTLNNQLAHHAGLLGLNRRSLPLYTLGMPNYLDTTTAMQLRPGALAWLEPYGLSPREFITVQDGWDANFPLSQPGARPTKAWHENSWAELVAELKRRHPDKKIVQIGSSKTGADIQGVDLNLRGKASLSDALALLKYTALHIDTEGGLVHMAHALGSRSLVLYGPTNAKFFGYSANVNLVPPCTDCWWLASSWMSDCVRGLRVPECMISHKPAAVADAVSEHLGDHPTPKGDATFGAPNAIQGGVVGVVNNAPLAAELSAAGYDVTHLDAAAQKNIQRTVDGMNYRQFIARPSNLPLPNQALDQLHFTADENPIEFAAELLEALRVLRQGGQAIIRAAGKDIAPAFAKAGMTPPAGAGDQIILMRA